MVFTSYLCRNKMDRVLTGNGQDSCFFVCKKVWEKRLSI